MATPAPPPAPTLDSLMADNRRLSKHLGILANRNLELEHANIAVQEQLEAANASLASLQPATDTKILNGASKGKEAPKVVAAKA